MLFPKDSAPIPCNGEAFQFATPLDRQIFAKRLLRGISYSVCCDHNWPYPIFAAVRDICERLRKEIEEGEETHEAIFEG